MSSYSFVQIVDLQQRAAFRGQDSDALRRRAETAEREVRRLRKRCFLCINMYRNSGIFRAEIIRILNIRTVLIS